MLAALGADVEPENGFEAMDALEELTGVSVPKPLKELRTLPERLTDVCDRDKMGAFVEDACARIFS